MDRLAADERRFLDEQRPDVRELLEVVLRAVDEGVTLQEPDGAIVFANVAALRLMGLDPAEGMPADVLAAIRGRFELYDESGAPLAVDELPGRRVLAGEPAAERTVRFRIGETGEERWALVRAVPIASGGEVRLAVNLFQDVTDRMRGEGSLRFLAEASAILASSLDYAATLESLADVTVPALADWFAADVLEEDGSVRRVALRAADPAKAELARELQRRYPSHPSAHEGTAKVLRTGRAELEREVTDEFLRSIAHDDEQLALLRQAGIRSNILVPLRARERTLGVLTFATAESGRTYTEGDLVLLEELARRAAVAIDNARLYHKAQRAGRQAEESLALLDTLLRTAPVGFGLFDRELRFLRINDALAEINGLPPGEHIGKTLTEVLPGLDPEVAQAYRRVIETGEPIIDMETAGETPAAPGVRRAWLASYYPVRTPAGSVIGVGAVVREITESKLAEHERVRLQERLEFMAEASTLLASSLDWETTLATVARLAVPRLADWCAIDMLGEGSRIERLAVAHVDPAKTEYARHLERPFPIDSGSAYGVANVLRSGAPQLVSEITDELLVAATEGTPELLEFARALGLRSSMIVPLVARDGTLGAITFLSADSGRIYDQADLGFAQDLARRAAIAVDNARLFQAAEERGHAARVLAHVADGVFLVDARGIVRLWNPAAESITGLRAVDVVGRPVDEAIPGWQTVSSLVPVAIAPARPASRAETVPLELSGRELWLSISGVGFAEGTVYAFRDLTEERAVEALKSDFVSTVSHELRTPLAAIYGAALTLRRDDLPLEDAQRSGLLGVIANESDRLARTVNDILWVSRLESGTLPISIESCDPVDLGRTVVEAARVHLPENVTLELAAAPDVPPASADPDKVRQALVNLIDNAVKYSPEGGPIRLEIESRGHFVRFAVRDNGLGIPSSEQRRVFQKFYRLDPHMARGVGGTGLGLYICRELVRRMDGRIWVESEEGRGSSFFIELAAADVDAHRLDG